jgi:hypothetical protein
MLTYIHCFWMRWTQIPAPSWVQMVWVYCGSGLGPLQKHSHTYIGYIEGISSHSVAVNRHMGSLSLRSTSLPVLAWFPYLGTNHTTMTKSKLGTTSDWVHFIIIPIESVEKPSTMVGSHTATTPPYHTITPKGLGRRIQSGVLTGDII